MSIHRRFDGTTHRRGRGTDSGTGSQCTLARSKYLQARERGRPRCRASRFHFEELLDVVGRDEAVNEDLGRADALDHARAQTELLYLQQLLPSSPHVDDERGATRGGEQLGATASLCALRPNVGSGRAIGTG